MQRTKLKESMMASSNRWSLRKVLGGAASALLLVCTAVPGHAQDKYPDKPIRMLVGFAAGGPTDVVARKLAARIGPILGQSVVIENKPGASTTIATAELVRAKPDGYTIYFTGSAALTITPLSIPGLTYDVAKDIAPIALVAAEHLAIGINPAVPARSLKELAALVKANPGKYSFASSGTGNIGHLTGELFNVQAGKLDMPHVAYKGAGPAMQDVLAGHVPVLAAGLGSMYTQHQSGKLVVLAVTDPKRSTIAKEIPTSAEAGFPELVTTSVFVVLAPAGTPASIIATLNNAIQKAMLDEEFLKDLRVATVEPITDSTPAKTKQFIDGELKKWADLVQSTGIKLN
jgi:tripartite-type tricarboxylate transporter receptor subunit TctC